MTKSQRRQRLIDARNPVETPPTEFLPYPPPPGYQWPPGESPATEWPQPSENYPGQNDPNVVSSGSSSGYNNPNGGGSSQPTNSDVTATQSNNHTYGASHVAWIVIVSILATGAVTGLLYWFLKKRKAGGGEEVGEKGATRQKMMRFWVSLGEKVKRKKKADAEAAPEE